MSEEVDTRFAYKRDLETVTTMDFEAGEVVDETVVKLSEDGKT
jgi:hypothetical protein